MLPLKPIMEVPREPVAAVVWNRRQSVRFAVRSWADLQNAPADARDEAITRALDAYDEGRSAASAIQVGKDYLRRIK